MNITIIIVRLAPPLPPFLSPQFNLAWKIFENHINSIITCRKRACLPGSPFKREYKIELWKFEGIIQSKPCDILKTRLLTHTIIRGQPINWNIVHCFNSWSWPSTFICLISFLSIIKNNSSWIQRDCKLTRINNTLNLDRIRMKTWSNNLISFFIGKIFAVFNEYRFNYERKSYKQLYFWGHIRLYSRGSTVIETSTKLR